MLNRLTEIVDKVTNPNGAAGDYVDSRTPLSQGTQRHQGAVLLHYWCKSDPSKSAPDFFPDWPLTSAAMYRPSFLTLVGKLRLLDSDTAAKSQIAVVLRMSYVYL